MPTAVGDRGDNPKRRIKYSDMNVEKNRMSGAYHISHGDDKDFLYSRQYYGYTKRAAMKAHKDQYERGE